MAKKEECCKQQDCCKDKYCFPKENLEGYIVLKEKSNAKPGFSLDGEFEHGGKTYHMYKKNG